MAGQITAAFAAFWIWFSFVAQIYASEFLSSHTALGWVNQPLVQLPWFRHVPPRLGNLPGELLLIVLVVLGTVLVGLGRKSFCKNRGTSQMSE